MHAQKTMKISDLNKITFTDIKNYDWRALKDRCVKNFNWNFIKDYVLKNPWLIGCVISVILALMTLNLAHRTHKGVLVTERTEIQQT